MSPGRAVWVKIRASEAERAEWHAKARSAGLTLSDLVRRSIGRMHTWTRGRPKHQAALRPCLSRGAGPGSCISRSTRFLPTRIPLAASRAFTFRWASPRNGLAFSTVRISCRSCSSLSAVFGPRFEASASGYTGPRACQPRARGSGSTRLTGRRRAVGDRTPEARRAWPATRTRSNEPPATPRTPSSAGTDASPPDSPVQAPQELPQLVPVSPRSSRITTSAFRCALHRFGRPFGPPRLFAESCSSVLRDILRLLSPGPRKGC